ncbi:MAG: Nif3-like dinuclear metal center hexameric protein [Oscillospiraceae bacterium]|jgi:dinuclear metal center YbgI/SA1388 family protein
MRNVKEILDYLEQKAPLSWQESYDNAGFLVGDAKMPVERVLVALDVTVPVVQEAADIGASLIVSHHPVVFHPLRSVTGGDGSSKAVAALIRNEISAICMHTNLDAAPGGVNDVLAAALGLGQTEVLLPMGKRETDGAHYGIGRIGELAAPLPFLTFGEGVKRALQAGGLRFYDAGKTVFRVAVGGGSCGSLLPEVIARGCDTFVTGDVKYDVFLEAAAMGVNVIDAGHYPTEQLVCETLASWLEEAFPGLEAVVSGCHRDVVGFL